MKCDFTNQRMIYWLWSVHYIGVVNQLQQFFEGILISKTNFITEFRVDL